MMPMGLRAAALRAAGSSAKNLVLVAKMSLGENFGKEKYVNEEKKNETKKQLSS